MFLEVRQLGSLLELFSTSIINKISKRKRKMNFMDKTMNHLIKFFFFFYVSFSSSVFCLIFVLSTSGISAYKIDVFLLL